MLYMEIIVIKENFDVELSMKRLSIIFIIANLSTHFFDFQEAFVTAILNYTWILFSTFPIYFSH